MQIDSVLVVKSKTVNNAKSQIKQNVNFVKRDFIYKVVIVLVFHALLVIVISVMKIN